MNELINKKLLSTSVDAAARKQLYHLAAGDDAFGDKNITIIATFANRFVNLRDFFQSERDAKTHLLSWNCRLPKCSLHAQYLHNDSDLWVAILRVRKKKTNKSPFILAICTYYQSNAVLSVSVCAPAFLEDNKRKRKLCEKFHQLCKNGLHQFRLYSWLDFLWRK